MGKQRKPYDKSVYRSFAMILQFGLNMVVPIGLMTALGIFLDTRFGTSWIMILLFFVGAIAGAQNVYRMAKQVYGTEKRGGTAAKDSQVSAQSREKSVKKEHLPPKES